MVRADGTDAIIFPLESIEYERRSMNDDRLLSERPILGTHFHSDLAPFSARFMPGSRV